MVEAIRTGLPPGVDLMFDQALQWAEIGRIATAGAHGSEQVSKRSDGTSLDQAIIETPGR